MTGLLEEALRRMEGLSEQDAVASQSLSAKGRRPSPSKNYLTESRASSESPR